MEGKIQGTTHLCQGQEAVSVGAVGALEDADYLTITYRGHGHALARGMSMEAAFGEVMGLTSGCCSGVGGSMHLTDFSRNLIGSFAIIGPSYSVGLGAAMSAKLRKSSAVAMAFCGDGATNIGTFHEALNMASVWRAPVVFIIENNLYGEYSPLHETTSLTNLADRAKAYAMTGRVVDGQDVSAVREVVSAAIERARENGEPTLIEAKTYRYRGHSRTDPASYRPEGELEQWKRRDPITLLGAQLADEDVMTVGEQQQLRAEIQIHVDTAAERASEASVLTLDETRALVYSENLNNEMS